MSLNFYNLHHGSSSITTSKQLPPLGMHHVCPVLNAAAAASVQGLETPF
jgi:hypothetical protein